ncbi:hypothetical protein ABMA10_00275 [Plantibacter sp. RU18]
MRASAGAFREWTRVVRPVRAVGLFVLSACYPLALLRFAPDGVSAWWVIGVAAAATGTLAVPLPPRVRVVLLLGFQLLSCAASPALGVLVFAHARRAARLTWLLSAAVTAAGLHAVLSVALGAVRVSEAVLVAVCTLVVFVAIAVDGREHGRLSLGERRANELLGAAVERELVLGHVIRRRERQGLGRELHDNLGLHLTTLRIYAQTLQQPDALQAAELADVVAVIDRAAVQAVEDLQHLVAQLADGQQGDDPRVLGEVFESFVRASSTHQLQLVSRSEGSIHHLPGEYQTALVSFFSEALTNTLKYAGQGPVNTALIVTADQAVFASVSSPLPDGTTRSRPHHSTVQGLLNLSARAHALKGSFVVHRSADRFHVEIALPPGPVDDA